MSKRIFLCLTAAVALMGAGFFVGMKVASRPSVSAQSERGQEQARPAESTPGEGLEQDGAVVSLTDAQIKRYGVVTETAAQGRRQTALVLNGEVVMNADRIAQIVPRVSGILREVRKNLGDMVREGEVMAVLESRELADAFASFRAARQRAEMAKANLAREDQLWKKRISAQQDYLQAQNEVASVRIEEQTARQKLLALGFSDVQLDRLTSTEGETFTRYELTAPFDGTVIEKKINLGEVLKDDSVAFRVADLSSVWANLDVNQKDLPQIHVGDEIVVSNGPGVPEIDARVSYIEPTVVEETRTVHVRAVIQNTGGRWRPGAFITGKMVMEEGLASITVPSDAVLLVDGRACLFLREKEGFRAQPVRTGLSDMGRVEVLDGLKPGQEYVARGAFTLKSELGKPEGE